MHLVIALSLCLLYCISQDLDNKIQIEVTDSKLGYCGKELYYFIHQLNSSESPNVVKPSKLLSRLRQK